MNEQKLAVSLVGGVLALIVVSLTVVIISQPAEAREIEPEWTWKVYPSDRTNTGALLRMKMDSIEQRVAEIIAEYEAEQAALEAEQQAWAEQQYYEPVYYAPSYSNDYDNDFQQQGRISGGEYEYRWYSQRVLPGGGLTELNNNGRHVESDGFIYDGDGYIAVASSDLPQGSVVETPFGYGKVYDNGCASGTIDIYTDF